jgi:hypothetical protein
MELRYLRDAADDHGLNWEYTEKVLSSRDIDVDAHGVVEAKERRAVTCTDAARGRQKIIIPAMLDRLAGTFAAARSTGARGLRHRPRRVCTVAAT